MTASNESGTASTTPRGYGDAYHGPDRFKADRNRQAILERLGWTFHRIRGSAYYRGPD